MMSKYQVSDRHINSNERTLPPCPQIKRFIEQFLTLITVKCKEEKASGYEVKVSQNPVEI